MKTKSKAEYKIPILFTIYNRLDTTKIVLEVIKKIKPTHLFLASDGPKSDKEKDKVEEVRRYVLSNIDWDVSLKTKFNINNKGCGEAMSSSIDWFFENVDMGIILEDDCLPNMSFFKYSEELLNYHKDNMDIWHISGSVLYKKEDYTPSYFYSVYPGIWGWATWSNRWKKYNFDMNKIDVKFGEYKYYKKSRISKSFFKEIKKKMESYEIDTWDFQWTYTIWKNNGLCITPNYNLISNIGFDNHATHTKNSNDSRSNIETQELKRIFHPKNIEIHNDDIIKKKHFSKQNIFKRILDKFIK